MLQKDSHEIGSIIDILAKSKKGAKRNNSSHKLLPILLEIVSEKQCSEILRIFAGKCIRFPSNKSLKEACLILLRQKELKKIK